MLADPKGATRLTPWRIALGYIAFSVLALALFAMPLWYGWRANIATFRSYVPAEEMQTLVELFQREGAAAVTAAVRSQAGTMPGDEVVLFAGPGKEVLAGTLRAWPAEIPDTPGTYGLAISLGAGRSMRVVASHMSLPGGYHLLMGRESVRFESLAERFWYGMAAALAIVLALGAVLAWLLARRTSAVRHSEGRYALAMEAAGDGHTDWNLQTGEHYISPRLLQICGYAPGTTFRDREEWVRRFPFHPEDRSKWERAVAAHFAGREPHFKMELRIVVRGEVRWTAFHFLSTRDAAGTPIRWTGSIADITEQKRADEAMRESEARFRSLIDHAPVAIVLTTQRPPRVLQVNPEFTRLFGFTADETVGRSLRELIAPNELHDNYAVNADAMTAGDRVEREVVRQRKDGSRFHVHLTGVPVRLSDGTACSFLMYRDLTERELAVNALRKSEERFALAVAGSDAGVWDYDFVARRHFSSARARELAGLPPEPQALPMTEEGFAALPLHPEDVPRRIGAMQAHLAGETPMYEGEFRVRESDGVYRWRRIQGLCVRDAGGKPLRMAGSISDIDARKRAEEALRLSEKRYALAMEVAEEGHWDWKVQTDEIFASAQALRILGVPQDAEYRTRGDIMARVRYHPEDRERILAEWGAALAGQALEQEFEYRLLRGEEPRWTRSRWKIFRDAAGVALRVIGIIADITARKLAEEARRLSEERYALAMETSEEGHFDWNVQTDEIFASAHMKQLLGLPADTEYRTRSDIHARVRYYPGERQRLEERNSRVLGGTAAQSEFEYRILRGDEVRWLRASWKIFRDADGAAQRVIGVISDITERKQAVDTLRESEARFRRMTELSADTYWEQDENLRYTQTGPGRDIAGYATDVNQGKTRWELCGEATPLSSSWLQHQAMLAAHQPFRDFEYRRVRPDGTIGYYSASGAPMFDAQGRFRGYRGVARDITEPKRFEEALRQSEERYALAVEGSNEGIFDWDLVSDRVYVSYRAQELFGLPRGELWRPRRDWRHILTFHPDDAPRLHDSIKAHIEGGAPTYDVEFRIVAPGGGVRWFRQRGIALRDASGKAYRVVGSIGDVTERHKAEEQLGTLERRTQRLEAMGTLAGGIAHDFNNILGAILGYGEMATRSAKNGTRLRRDVDAIMGAGERGRALVERILAFSRSGVGERVPVHVEAVVREALDQVAASLRENVTVMPRLRAGRAAMLGDSTQVHQVVMNLASNAVQAMPQGGVLRVTLETASFAAARPATVGSIARGDYIVLRVGDTGTGIPDDVLERMFDPFFTTKEVGVGSGLGLSLVHGIVTSVEGAIDVTTRLGKGTAFSVYLHRSGDAPEKPVADKRPLPRGKGERVLVVDDEAPLVRLATETLERLGYAAVGFTSSTAALAAFRADPGRFDAVLTDERMPELSGLALIREVRGIRDAIPVVLMSGYLGMESVGADVVLRKPVSARDLAASLARALRP